MNKLLIILTILGAGFLSFLSGVLIGEYNVDPMYSALSPAFKLAEQVYDRPLDRDMLVNSGIWNGVKTAQTGVSSYDRSRAFNGYTLLSSGHEQKAFLYDMDGKVQHTWSLPFRTAWPAAPHVENPAKSARLYWRDMHLFKDGSLLAAYEAMGDVRGYGLVKMDAQSNPVWAFAERTAGSFAVGPDGRIYTVVRKIRTTPIEELPHIICPFVDDELVTLSSDGQVISRVRLLDELIKTVGAKDLSTLEPVPGGVLKTESVDLVSVAMAGKLPQAEEGDLLLSMANARLLAIVGKDGGAVKWVGNGTWKKQHCAVSMPDGNILLFDNRGLERQGMGSSVVVYNPAERKPVWIYPGSKSRPLSSKKWASAQPLPNGNFLVTESMCGRVFEITREKHIVWDWNSPFRAGKDDAYVACVWGGKRYAAADLDFKFNGGKK